MVVSSLLTRSDVWQRCDKAFLWAATRSRDRDVISSFAVIGLVKSRDRAKSRDRVVVGFFFVIGRLSHVIFSTFFRYGSSGQSANQPYNKQKNKQFKERRGSPRVQHQDTGKKHGRKTPETERTAGEQWRLRDFNGHVFQCVSILFKTTGLECCVWLLSKIRRGVRAWSDTKQLHVASCKFS